MVDVTDETYSHNMGCIGRGAHDPGEACARLQAEHDKAMEA